MNACCRLAETSKVMLLPLLCVCMTIDSIYCERIAELKLI